MITGLWCVRRGAWWVAVGMVMAMTGLAWAVEGDIVFHRDAAESDTPPAVFSHWSHRIRHRCYVCHPALFKMQAHTEVITMDQIMAGKYCGACHNGRAAWPVTFETCQRCHYRP